MPKKRKGGGRPPGRAALQRKIDAYFAEADAEGKLPSEPALAAYLGISRGTLLRWWNGEENAELQDTVAMAYDAIADRYIQLLRADSKNMASFLLLALKQPAFGAYGERSEQKQNAAVRLLFGAGMDENDLK